jgi:Xaa-Pro aminopeptidase
MANTFSLFTFHYFMFNIRYSKVTIILLFLQLFSPELYSQNCPEIGITLNEYAIRRKALLSKTDTNTAIVMKAKDASTEYDMMHYRQDLNFLYLTGINEAGGYLLMSRQGIDLGGNMKQTVFFVPAYSVINDKRGNFCNETDTIINVEEFRKIFNKMVGGISLLFFSSPDLGFVNDWLNDKPYFILTEVKKNLKQQHPGLKVKEVGSLIATLRGIKSPAEIELTRKAINMTGDGIRNALKTCKAGIWEYELQAAIEFEMTRQGSEATAFNCIIGSGENSLILHYDKNNCQTKNGDVVVMDVGAQYKGYAADITRTIPVSGKFTKEQKEIYNIVLAVQNEAIKMIRPGITNKELENKASTLLTKAGYKSYIQHGITHPVGLDVHDISSGDTLVEGMIITIEPGLYIPADDEKLPSAYHGFGIRIEDDILVTKDGYEVLSRNIPKDADEIEKLMK